MFSAHRHLMIVMTLAMALSGCGAIESAEIDNPQGNDVEQLGADQANLNREGAQERAPGASDELLSGVQVKETQAHDSEGHPLFTFLATTIDTCADYSPAVKQSFCAFYDKCPALCSSAGYELLEGPVQQKCLSTYQLLCLCICDEVALAPGDQGPLAPLDRRSSAELERELAP